MKRIFWIGVLPVVIIGGLIWVGSYAYENRLYASFSHLIGDETKRRLKDTIFVFQTKRELEQQKADLERRIEQLDDVQQLFEVALRNNPNLPRAMPFTFVGSEEKRTNKDVFEVISYETPFVPLDYFGRRAYLETHSGNLWLITAKGTVGHVPLTDIEGDSFSMVSRDTNLLSLIENPEFYELSELSIKDALVVGDQLLLSYTKSLRPGCITLAITAADITDDDLKFSDIFVPDECVEIENDYGEFSGNQSGGRMQLIGPNRLMFSTGEMRYRDLAQDPESFFGKILDIDLVTGTFEVQSMGHRNPQGMYHDAAANVTFISEHGPEGGDEINVNRKPQGEPENFGWPVSSYGEHYSTAQSLYDKAPLHKSHEEFGFLEPEMHFELSISPTQLLPMGPDPRDPDRYSLMLGTMGFDYREGDESLHIFDFDKNFKIIARERIVLDDRVRDMIQLPDGNRYALFLEGDSYEFGTIAIVTLDR